MTVAKPISVVNPSSSLDQKPALSRLSKRELEEVHTASTHYPQQDHHATETRNPSGCTSEDASQKSASQKSSSAPASDSSTNTKKTEGKHFENLVTGQEKKNSLVSKNFYHEKEELAEDVNSDADQSDDGLHHGLDHLPSASSLAGGMTALLSHIKSPFPPYHSSLSLDDDGSIVPTTTVTGSVLKVDLNASQVKEALPQRQAISQGEILKTENLASDSSAFVDAVALMTQNDILATGKPLLASDEKVGSAVTADLLKSQSSIVDINSALKNEAQLSNGEIQNLASNLVDIPVGIIKKEDEGTLLGRLGVAVESVLPSLNKQAATDHVVPKLVESQPSINTVQNTAAFSTPLKESLLDDDEVTGSLDLEEKLDDVSSHDQKVESGSVRNVEVRGKVFATQDAGGDTDFNGTQHERAHEATHKMAEGEENNAMMARSAIARTEVAPVTGSSGSSGADLSESVAAALRVTHLLDELTAAVSRLRLDSSDGKEMTIQLRRDVLPETNIHIVSTTKQMEVSFLTSNAASNLLLNTHLTTLQNHLNSLCPGQVINVQTQLTPSSGSSQMGSEQDRSHDDLASFDQGNRGNSNNDNDTL